MYVCVCVCVCVVVPVCILRVMDVCVFGWSCMPAYVRVMDVCVCDMMTMDSVA